MQTKVENVLKVENENPKTTYFIEMDKVDSKKNQLAVKNILNEVKHTISSRDKLDKLMLNTYKNKTIVLFTENDELKYINTLSYPFSGVFGYKKYFVIPFFDFRNGIFESLYLLNLSKNNAVIYEVTLDSLKPIEVDWIHSFEEETKYEYEQESIQSHGTVDKPIFHGQNASNSRDAEVNKLELYFSHIGKSLNKFLEENKAKLIIASTAEHSSRLLPELKEDQLSEVQLEGSFEHISESEILKLITQRVSENISSYVKEIENQIEVSKSSEIESLSFVDILSIIQDGRIDKLFIGKMGVLDDDYTNPIAPLGLNYIAYEVLRFGGEVEFFPDEDFEFSENNIAYKFRY